MITSQQREVNTRGHEWQREAARLASLKRAFFISGFDEALDQVFVNELAKKFGLNVTIDSILGRAYFTVKADS